MGTASRVMYSIANFFTWIIVIFCIAGIVLFPLTLVGVLANNTGSDAAQLTAYTVYLAIVLVFALISIGLVRTAKRRGTSKGWDLLFIIIGILSGNIFLLLGGIFGLIALN